MRNRLVIDIDHYLVQVPDGYVTACQPELPFDPDGSVPMKGAPRCPECTFLVETGAVT